MKKEIIMRSKCCRAEIRYTGGGYDGKDIIPVVSYCSACGNTEPEILRKVGRPKKEEVPF